LGLGNHVPRDLPQALTPDDLFAGAKVRGPVVVVDDEQYFMAGAWAERLAVEGHEVTLVTPWATPSTFTIYTNEQDFVLERLLHLGVELRPFTHVTGHENGVAHLACAYTGRVSQIACETLILCTGRLSNDSLFHEIQNLAPKAARVGDCLQPSSIADAIYSAHRFARLLGQDDPPPAREFPPPR
jgi:dimethylamine/trimethylamine dehydrogenase